ncbi:MAG TPA: glycosyltransferase [Thiolapillus brandeum]|uniref:Glycosyltransferase n=1 Tax=Thiolapillus brandeum TaxID=1076588 RepID=A0A7C5IYP0_9GAMM|nr:glycosyltransferase [Thiolapillus brandeum]
MKLAFVAFKYFPHGGMQNNLLRMARECAARGHQVHVYTMSWGGERPEGVEVHLLPQEATTNHARYRAFHRALQRELEAEGIDRVVGFNRLPGLDFYYAADPCLRERLSRQYRFPVAWLPRYRQFLAWEAAVFGRERRTRILLVSARQKAAFQRHYGTPDERFFELPPGIQPDRKAGPDAGRLRSEARREFGIREEEHWILCIGSGFRTKGLDRSLKALAALPEPLRRRTRLLALGTDKAAPFERLARRLGVADRFRILPGRDDIPRILQGGDLLLHPAYHENTGNILLEAAIAGLPVLTTSVCGYAHYIEEAQCGRVLPEPFSQAALDAALAEMLVSPERARWRTNGIRFGEEADIYGRIPHAVEFILS